jgi:RNA polymerase sigma-54 factor
MKQTLSLKLSQHLALTPQLQQSIRLLQLSTLELNQELEQICSENPLLERDDDPLANAYRVAGDGHLSQSTASSTPADGAGEEAPAGPAAEAPDRPDMDASDGLLFGNSRQTDDEDDTAPQLACSPTSLREHLLSQLGVMTLSERDYGLVAMLIEALDEDGYLTQPLEEIALMFPPEFELDETELRMALNLLQSFDPAGVAARDAAESLVLQLKHADLSTFPEAQDERILKLAREIAGAHLPLLAGRDYIKLKKLTGANDDELRAAQTLIKRLNPHPGGAFGKREADPIVPDVVVRKVKNVWQAFLNPDVMPKLRINQLYAQVLRQHRGSGAGGLSNQLQEAKWLIKNVQQRFDTILRVAQAIVDRQRGFFTHGEVAMRPLVLREIADTLGLHESTVSRVTNHKFMLTPYGTFELKYFFGSHVATDTGGAASSTAIRALIKQLVSAEDPKKPLSDSQIADMLGEQGIMVARRTIAKYREALKIPPVSLRKAL